MADADFLSQITVVDYMLITAIVWLSGLFVWLIKRFMLSFEKNTTVMTKVNATLDAMDRKIDASAGRDIEMVKMLEKISAKQEITSNI